MTLAVDIRAAERERILSALRANGRVWISGPPRSGKTHLACQVRAAYGDALDIEDDAQPSSTNSARLITSLQPPMSELWEHVPLAPLDEKSGVSFFLQTHSEQAQAFIRGKRVCVADAWRFAPPATSSWDHEIAAWIRYFAGNVGDISDFATALAPVHLSMFFTMSVSAPWAHGIRERFLKCSQLEVARHRLLLELLSAGLAVSKIAEVLCRAAEDIKREIGGLVEMGLLHARADSGVSPTQLTRLTLGNKDFSTEPAKDYQWLIAQDGRWFQTLDGVSVSVGGKTLPAILKTLYLAWRETPGVAVSWTQLTRAAWGDERVRPESIRNRLHVSLWALRNGGLRPLLQSTQFGCFLDPRATILEVPAAKYPSGTSIQRARKLSSTAPPPATREEHTASIHDDH